jgi:hypothetical protein
MSILKELIEQEEEQIDALPLMEALDEAIVQLNERNGKGGFIKKAIGGAKDLITNNPGMATAAAVLAVSAYGNYQKNKRNTIRLHGKTTQEKKLMQDIVNKLTADKSWNLKKVKFEGGGKSWILARRWKS